MYTRVGVSHIIKQRNDRRKYCAAREDDIKKKMAEEEEERKRTKGEDEDEDEDENEENSRERASVGRER